MITIAAIQAAVAAHFAIPVAEMVSQRRGREVARPRQVAMFLAKQMTPKSLPDIGRRFGGRDHTTVIHAVRQIERLSQADPALRRTVDRLSVLLLIKASVGESGGMAREASELVFRQAWRTRNSVVAPPISRPAPPQRPAPPKRSFEEQLAMVERGEATCSRHIPIRRADPDRTLGGVSPEII